MNDLKPTRDEVETWVNPASWDDQAKAERVIEAILAEGSPRLSVWVRLAGESPEEVRQCALDDQMEATIGGYEELAGDQDDADLHEHVEALEREAKLGGQLVTAGRARHNAHAAAKAATAHLREIVVAAADTGMSEVEIAQLAQVTRMTVRSWTGKTTGAAR